eukprot:1131096-Rhodomonas_salina.3
MVQSDAALVSESAPAVLFEAEVVRAADEPSSHIDRGRQRAHAGVVGGVDGALRDPRGVQVVRVARRRRRRRDLVVTGVLAVVGRGVERRVHRRARADRGAAVVGRQTARALHARARGADNAHIEALGGVERLSLGVAVLIARLDGEGRLGRRDRRRSEASALDGRLGTARGGRLHSHRERRPLHVVAAVLDKHVVVLRVLGCERGQVVAAACGVTGHSTVVDRRATTAEEVDSERRAGVLTSVLVRILGLHREGSSHTGGREGEAVAVGGGLGRAGQRGHDLERGVHGRVRRVLGDARRSAASQAGVGHIVALEEAVRGDQALRHVVGADARRSVLPQQSVLAPGGATFALVEHADVVVAVALGEADGA